MSADHPTPADPTAAAAAHGDGRQRRRFVRHYLEMVAAMVIGMVVLGAALRAGAALAGLTWPMRSPGLLSLEMAAHMAVAMLAWMRFRRHGWAATLEMAAAMFVPVIVLLPLMWLGAIDGDALLPLEHAVMLPLMWLVMLRRRDEYGG